jgi:hypothetical protein
MAFDFGALGTGAGGITSIAGGLYSAIEGSQYAQQSANISLQEAETEIQQNNLRQQQMQVTSQRQQLQTVRQGQMARAIAQTTATNQGAQFGSGLQGAYGSISGQTSQNQLGVSQNEQIGMQAFALDTQLDMEKASQALVQSQQQSSMAFGSLLGGIGGSLGSIFKMGTALAPLLAA